MAFGEDKVKNQIGFQQQRSIKFFFIHRFPDCTIFMLYYLIGVSVFSLKLKVNHVISKDT